MKKNKQKKCFKLLAVFLSYLLFTNVLQINAQEGENQESAILAAIPKEALAYVENNQNRFIITTQNSETMRISVDNSQLELGNPYIIYLPYEVQDEAYYYPMIDTSTKKVVSVVGIIGTDQGYVYEVSNEMVDILNELDYVNVNWIFYVYGPQMYAESYDRVVPIGEFSVLGTLIEEDRKNELEFGLLSYEEKINYISQKINKFKPFSPIQWKSEEEKLNVLLGTKLTLYHPMGQYGYGMCWASSAATIINYLQNKVITGFDVCNRVGIGYDQGGSIYDIQEGLGYYGVIYSQVRNRYLSWNEITANIDAEKPIALCAFSGSSGNVIGHTGVIYGYSGSGSSGEIIIWDPYGKNGTSDGYEIIVGYNNIYKCFNINGITYSWEATLSYQ